MTERPGNLWVYMDLKKKQYLFVEVGSNSSADLKSYFAMLTAAAPMFKTAIQVVFDLRLVRHCPRR